MLSILPWVIEIGPRGVVSILTEIGRVGWGLFLRAGEQRRLLLKCCAEDEWVVLLSLHRRVVLVLLKILKIQKTFWEMV